MTPHDVVRRVQRELETWAAALSATSSTDVVTPDDLDELDQALCDLLESCREDLVRRA